MSRRGILWALAVICAVAVGCSKGDQPVQAAKTTPDKTIRLSRVVLLDPNDGQPAFSLLAPSDWKASCKIVYRMDRPAAPGEISIIIQGPDGAEFNVVPQTWATWPPLAAYRTGHDVVQCPRKATDFFEQRVLPRLRPELRGRGVTVIEKQDYPKLSEALSKMAPQVAGSRTAGRVASIRAEYTDPRSGQVMHEDLAGVLWISDRLDFAATTWVSDRVFAYRAPKGALGKHADLVACMAGSIRVDAAWMRRAFRAMGLLFTSELETSEAVAKQTGILAQSARDTARIISETYQNRQASRDRGNQAWADAIRGTASYQTPHEDYPVSLPGGYDHVWTSGKGEYILSNDPLFNPNQGSNVTWRQLRPAR